MLLLLLLDCIARTTHADAVYCYQLSSVVCWSVTVVSPAKTAEPIEMPFGLRTWVSPRNDVLDGVEGEGDTHCNVQGHCGELCKNSRTDRDTVVLSDWTGPRNHVLDGVQIPQWKGAI